MRRPRALAPAVGFAALARTASCFVVAPLHSSTQAWTGGIAERAQHGQRRGAVRRRSESRCLAMQDVQIYDTTLRDGTQMEGISVSVNDKLKIARSLADFGMHYIEGGWPGSNPKDQQFFERAREELPADSWRRVVAFGSTRRKNISCEKDAQLTALLAAGTKCVTIVAKASDLHVTRILEVPLEENVAMVRESVGYLKGAGREVMVDLEHFFDGFKANREYVLSVCEAAVASKADVLVLCDTNGGTLPWEIDEAVTAVKEAFPNVRLGVHCHNDMDLAVSNSIQAVRSGCTVVQGTVNGIGERTGNANLVSIIPTLQLKMDIPAVGENLGNLTALSRLTDETLNRVPEAKAPFVGKSAFAHKGGLHVSAVNKIPESYQHIDPALVGNVRRVLVSDLSGRSNILSKVEEFGMGSLDELKGSSVWNKRMGTVLEAVKDMEQQGYTFEGADASVSLLIRRTMAGYAPPFQLQDYMVQAWDAAHGFEGRVRSGGVSSASAAGGGPVGKSARATVKVKLPHLVDTWSSTADASGLSSGAGDDDCVRLEVAEGNGPVNALGRALYKALLPSFPSLKHVVLTDYKVRILDQGSATAANTRVMVEFHDSLHKAWWTTVGVNTNIISASLGALLDGFEFALVEYAPSCSLARSSDNDSAAAAPETINDQNQNGAANLPSNLAAVAAARA